MKEKIYSLVEIKNKVEELNKSINLPESKLPAYGSDYGNKPTYIKVEQGEYFHIRFGYYRNQSNEEEILRTLDINELLFSIFQESTFMIANEYERQHRILNQDNRIILFQKHIAILDSLPLEKKFINKLKEHYDYLLSLKKPLPIPDKWFGK